MKPASYLLSPLDWPALESIILNKQLVADSRSVQAGEVFLAYGGISADRRKYIAAAIERGAAGVLWEKEDGHCDNTWQVSNLAISHLKMQAGVIAARLYEYPSRHMQCVAVTGTNGKTSTAHALAQAFNALGQCCAVMGTLGNGFLGQLASSSLTTSDAVTIQRLLAQYRLHAATHLTMEVSSHALAQGRAHGVEFDIGVFTNLSRDHLDYHGSMQRYGQAKARLFEWESLKAAVINADDAFGQTLLNTVKIPTLLSYGVKQGDIRAVQIDATLSGMTVNVATPWGEATFTNPSIGYFNVYNLLATLSTLLVSGIALQDAVRVLPHIQPVLGRMQKIGGGELPLVIVDYSHTPDALEKALLCVRETIPQTSQLYCVFGCGGERDKGKRPLMAEVAMKLADIAIVTSDNPRGEDPQQIIDDIVIAFDRNDSMVCEIDRQKAIAFAIHQARAQDVVLIAGKGHETYQEIAGIRHPFDDAEMAERELAKWSAP